MRATDDPRDLAAGFVRPDWKPERVKKEKRTGRTPRLRASKERWAEIRERKEGPCRVCLYIDTFPDEAAELRLTHCGMRVSYHHLVGRDLLGGDTESNIVPLGGDGVQGHHGMVQRLERPACMALRVMMRDDEYSYVVAKGGEGFLDRYYPARREVIGSAATAGDSGRLT